MALKLDVAVCWPYKLSGSIESTVGLVLSLLLDVCCSVDGVKSCGRMRLSRVRHEIYRECVVGIALTLATDWLTRVRHDKQSHV